MQDGTGGNKNFPFPHWIMSQEIVDISTDNGDAAGSVVDHFTTVGQFDSVQQQYAVISARVAQNSTGTVQLRDVSKATNDDRGILVQGIRTECATKVDVNKVLADCATRDQVEQVEAALVSKQGAGAEA